MKKKSYIVKVFNMANALPQAEFILVHNCKDFNEAREKVIAKQIKEYPDFPVHLYAFFNMTIE